MFDPLADFVRMSMLMGDVTASPTDLNTLTPPNLWHPDDAQPTGTRLIADGEAIDSDVVNRVAIALSAQIERVLLQMEQVYVHPATIVFDTAHAVVGPVGRTTFALLTNTMLALPDTIGGLPLVSQILDQEDAEVLVGNWALTGVALEISDINHLDTTPAYVLGEVVDYVITTLPISQVYKWGVELSASAEQVVSGTVTDVGGSYVILSDAAADFVTDGVMAGWVVCNRDQNDFGIVTGVAPTILTIADGMINGSPNIAPNEYVVQGPDHAMPGMLVVWTGSASNNGTYLIVQVDGANLVLSKISTDVYGPGDPLPEWDWENAWSKASPSSLVTTDPVAGTLTLRTLGKYAVNPIAAVDQPFPSEAITAGEVTEVRFRFPEYTRQLDILAQRPFVEIQRPVIGAAVAQSVKQIKGFTTGWGIDNRNELWWTATPADSIESINRRLNTASLDGIYRMDPERAQAFPGSYEAATTGSAGKGRIITIDGGAVELQAENAGNVADINRMLLRMVLDSQTLAPGGYDIIQLNYPVEYVGSPGTGYLPMLSMTAAVADSLDVLVGGVVGYRSTLTPAAGGLFPMSLKTADHDGCGSIVYIIDSTGDTLPQVGYVQSRDWNAGGEQILVQFRVASELPTDPTPVMHICQPLYMQGTPPTNVDDGLLSPYGQVAHHLFSAPSIEPGGVHTTQIGKTAATAAFLGWSGPDEGDGGTPVARFMHSRLRDPLAPPVSATSSIHDILTVAWLGLDVGLAMNSFYYVSDNETFGDVTIRPWQDLTDVYERIPVVSARHLSEGKQDHLRSEVDTLALGMPWYPGSAGAMVEGAYLGRRHGRVLAWTDNTQHDKATLGSAGVDPLGYGIAVARPLYDDATFYGQAPLVEFGTIGGGTSLDVTISSEDAIAFINGEMARATGVVCLTIVQASSPEKIGTYHVSLFNPNTLRLSMTRPGYLTESFAAHFTGKGYFWCPVVSFDQVVDTSVSGTEFERFATYTDVPSPLRRLKVQGITAIDATSVTYNSAEESTNFFRIMEEETEWVIFNYTRSYYANVLSISNNGGGSFTINHNALIGAPVAPNIADEVYAIHYNWKVTPANLRRSGAYASTSEVSELGQLGVITAHLDGYIPVSGSQTMGSDTASLYYWKLDGKNIHKDYQVSAGVPLQTMYNYAHIVDMYGQVAWIGMDLTNGAVVGSIYYTGVNPAHGPDLNVFTVSDTGGMWFQWKENALGDSEVTLATPMVLNLSAYNWLMTPLLGSVGGAGGDYYLSFKSALTTPSNNALASYYMDDSGNGFVGGYDLANEDEDSGAISYRRILRMWTWAINDAGGSLHYAFDMPGVDWAWADALNGYVQPMFAVMGLVTDGGGPYTPDMAVAQDREGMFLRAVTYHSKHADLQESNAYSVLGYGHVDFWGGAIAGTYPYSLYGAAVAPETVALWPWTSGDNKANLPGSYAEDVPAVPNGERRTGYTISANYLAVQPAASGTFTPMLLQICTGDDAVVGGWGTKEVWYGPNITTAQEFFLRLPFERPLPGSLLQNIRFEFSARDLTLAGADSLTDASFGVYLERADMVSVSPLKHIGTFGVDRFSAPRSGYENIRINKTPILLYDVATNWPGGNPEDVSLPWARNIYTQTLLSSFSAEYPWFSNPTSGAALGRVYDPIAGVTLPHSRLGKTSGASYPCWFPRLEIDSVTTHTGVGANVYQYAKRISFNTTINSAREALGVITNPFVVWGPVVAGTYPASSVSRSQLMKGDFLYVWLDDGHGRTDLWTFPILGEMKGVAATPPTLVIFDPYNQFPAVPGGGGLYCTVPAFINTDIRLWFLPINENALDGMECYFHHAELEALAISQLSVLPSVHTQDYFDTYHEDDP